MTPTELMLFAVHRAPVVPLEDVCEKYLRIELAQARNEAGRGTLELPTFRLRDSQKAPLMVSLKELATYIDSKSAEAKSQWVKCQV